MSGTNLLKEKSIEKFTLVNLREDVKEVLQTMRNHIGRGVYCQYSDRITPSKLHC